MNITPKQQEFLTAIQEEFGFTPYAQEAFKGGMIFLCKIENKMPLLFETIEVKILIHDKGPAYVEYSYSHPSKGWNGYTFATAYDRYGGIEIFPN